MYNFLMLLRSVLRHITPLNLLLLGIIAAAYFYAVTPLFGIGISLPVPKLEATAEKKDIKTEDAQAPSISEYVSIADLNLFHPERIIPPEKKADQLPKPEFILYGTLIDGATQIAYLEDLKAPHSTAGRGQRQRALKLGQVLSRYTLKEIHHDRVVMSKEDEMIEVKIEAKKRVRTGDTASAVAAPPQTQTAQPSPAATPPASSKTGSRPPGFVSRPPPAGMPVPDQRAISGVTETSGSGIQKRKRLSTQQPANPQ